MKPDLGGLHNNLGIVLRRLGRPAEAAVACGKAVELSPDSAEAHSNLADVLKRLERFDEAAAAYRRAIALKPGSTDVYRRLAAVLLNSDKLDEATEVLRQWLRREPDDPIARHMLAAYCGEKTPPRASDDYVRRVFDEFAATFDGDLQELDYQGPRLIGEAVTAELDEGAGGLDVLDAGCGTGLCGPLLRPVARRLIGVDLSALMIQHARGRESVRRPRRRRADRVLERPSAGFRLDRWRRHLQLFRCAGTAIDGGGVRATRTGDPDIHPGRMRRPHIRCGLST